MIRRDRNGETGDRLVGLGGVCGGAFGSSIVRVWISQIPSGGWMWVCFAVALAIVAMAIGGYDTGLSGSRRFIAITLSAALAFSVVLALVIVLERPHQHLYVISQAPMIDLQEDIRRSMQSQP